MLETRLELDPVTGNLVANVYLDGTLIASIPVPGAADEKMKAPKPEPPPS